MTSRVNSSVQAGSFWLANGRGRFVIHLESRVFKAGSFRLANRSGKQFVIQLEPSEVKAGSFWLAIRAGKQFVIHLEPSEVKAGSFWLANGRGRFVIHLEPRVFKSSQQMDTCP